VLLSRVAMFFIYSVAWKLKLVVQRLFSVRNPVIPQSMFCIRDVKLTH